MTTSNLGVIHLVWILCQEWWNQAPVPHSPSLDFFNSILKQTEKIEREILSRWQELTPAELGEKLEAIGLELSSEELEELLRMARGVLRTPIKYSTPVGIPEGPFVNDQSSPEGGI